MARPKTIKDCIECGEPGYARERCRRHYKAWQRTAKAAHEGEQCSFQNEHCDARKFAKGLCYNHYQLVWSREKFDREPGSVGRRMAHKDQEARFWARVDTSGGPDACHPWTGASDENGYGIIRWNGRDQRAHRVAYFLYTGQEIPSELDGCHKCDDPPCCNGVHIFPGTRAENLADMRTKGRGVNPPRKAGEEHHAAKLTTTDVRTIRARRVAGEPARMIAADYGLSIAHTYAIIGRRAWREIE